MKSVKDKAIPHERRLAERNYDLNEENKSLREQINKLQDERNRMVKILFSRGIKKW